VQERYGGSSVRLKYSGEIPESALYRIASKENNEADLLLGDGVDEALVLRELVEAGVLVRSFITSRLSLDEIFVRVYGRHNGRGEDGGNGAA
jgi:ABC-2 type transport system ATP-binding protein